MLAGEIVLGVVLCWISAVAVWSLTKQVEQANRRAEMAVEGAVRPLVAEHEDVVGLLAEELTANRAAFEDTLRAVLAHSERLIYPGADTAAVQTPYEQRVAADLPPLPPEVTGDFPIEDELGPFSLDRPYDTIPADVLDTARVETTYAPPLEPDPDRDDGPVTSPTGAAFIEDDDMEPFGVPGLTRPTTE